MAMEQHRYDGKTVLVIGGATGMGAAAAKIVMDLGAKAIVMDVAEVTYPVSQSLQVDLRKQASVDEALTKITSPIDAIFSCAGVADGFPALMQINFISQHYIIERLVEQNLLASGSAIAMISSAAGLSWMNNLPQLLEFLALSDWDAAVNWVADHEGADSYTFSKQAMCAYVAHQAFPLLKKGIRINSIMPGPTDTPLARANADTWLGFGAGYREDAGIDALSPEQIGNTLAFLCSDAASGVNGINLLVDGGHISAAMTGAYNDPALAALM